MEKRCICSNSHITKEMSIKCQCQIGKNVKCKISHLGRYGGKQHANALPVNIMDKISGEQLNNLWAIKMLIALIQQWYC